MKTVELIHKLSELGRLVEIWEEPTMQDCFNLGWRQNSKSKYLFFIRGGEVKKDISPRDIFNHICTQKAFKAEVRKVAGELIEHIGIPLEQGNRDEVNEIKELAAMDINKLFEHFLKNYSSYEYQAALTIAAIALKMGVELESEGK